MLERGYINRKNKQAPRLQVIAKQYALRRFILKAIANALIKPSNAMSWSHPHLTMKPTGEHRVCMDWKGMIFAGARMAGARMIFAGARMAGARTSQISQKSRFFFPYGEGVYLPTYLQPHSAAVLHK